MEVHPGNNMCFSSCGSMLNHTFFLNSLKCDIKFLLLISGFSLQDSNVNMTYSLVYRETLKL